jgi:pyruvate/2-oxoglutarate dehydrogenase complex dihydrolipoamide dehydrogenase (E3) component
MAAARAAIRLRRRAVLVQDGPVGGDCTFTGCVPSKTLIEAAAAGVPFGGAMTRVRSTIADVAATETADVLRGGGIEVVEGRARFTGPRSITVEGRTLTAGRVVVATGSTPLLPPIPGLADGPVLTSDTIWELREPPASLVVLGGGAIGCELAQALARFGVRVTVVEATPRLLPKEEPAAGEVIADVFKREGIELRLGASVTRVERPTPTGVRVVLDDASQLTADALLVAVGRSPATSGLELPAAGIDTDAKGFVRTDDHLATSADGVYAAGDVAGRLQFTHAADEMGRIAATNALHRLARLRLHTASIPWVTFTDPEVARVGMTEAQAAGHRGRVAHLPLTAVDRALTAERTDGFIQLLAGPRRLTGNLAGGRLLGATIVAPRAGEMIHEVALAMRSHSFTGRLAQTVHAYPTWSVGVRSAAALFFFTLDGRTARKARPQ